MKKLLCWMFSILMLFNMTCSAIAVTENTMGEDVIIELHTVSEPEIDYQSAVYNEDGSITYEVLNVEEMAASMGISLEKIRGMQYISVPLSDMVEDTKSRANIFDPLTIENVQDRGLVCLAEIIAEQTATNATTKPITKNISISVQTTHSYKLSLEAGVSVEAAEISSAVWV